MSIPSPLNPVHTSADFPSPAPAPALLPSDAIDAADRAAPPLTKEDFARRWKFASFFEMFEASNPIGDAGSAKHWILTPLRGGKWLLWNEKEMDSAQEFDSRDDALLHMQ